MHPAFATIVDYAGLFPPAALTMDAAVAAYADHRQSGERWMLGRFVVPASRLAELASSVACLAPAPTEPWELSVTIGAEHEADLARIAELAAGRFGDLLPVVAVEVRVGSADEVATVTAAVAGPWEVYLEVPHLEAYDEILPAIRAAGAMAKLRTGGVTPEAFPAPAVVARFLAAAVEAGVPFKATAGLHHPWRGRYPLTYEPDAAAGPMFGFAAVLVATAALRRGASVAVAQAILEEEDPGAFRSEGGGLAWREQHLTAGDLAAARRLAFRAFGSCSFREPADELTLGVAS